MEQIKKFLRSRGFTLALLACLVAAAAAGVWAVRTVRDELKKSYDDLTLVWCTNPPHCRAHPRLPAVQLRLPPRSPSRAGS